MVVLSSVAFVLLGLITMWVIIGAKGHPAVKAILIPITIAFPVWIAVTLYHERGKPTVSVLPEKFIVDFVEVQEPRRILILADDMSTREEDEKFFELPYSRPLHEAAIQALQMMKKGKKVVGTREGIEALMEGGDGQGKGKGGGKGKGKGKGGEGRIGKKGGKQGFQGLGMNQSEGGAFYELPPAQYPVKNPPQGL